MVETLTQLELGDVEGHPFHGNQWSEPPTSEERSRIGTYIRHGYARVNSQLRSGAPDMGKTAVLDERDRPITVGHLTSALDSAIAKATLKSDTTLYRGVTGHPDFLDLRPGDSFVDHGFTSTTTNRGYAREWSGSQLEIEAPAGSHALSVSEAGVKQTLGKVGDESEVILPRGAEFKITHRDEKSDGTVSMRARLLAAVTASLPLELGDVSGHDFHGNQWTVSSTEKVALVRDVKNLQDELTRQGVSENSPIRGVIDHRGYKIAVSRGVDGKINGALAYTNDRGSVHLQDLRALDKGRGVGYVLMRHAAQGAKEMTVTSAISTAVPFYQRMGGEFYAAKSNPMRPPTAENLTWSGFGQWDRAATEALARGEPVDKRISLDEGYANHQRAGGNPEYMATAMLLELGDSEGHPFHGNQWRDGDGRHEPVQRPSQFRAPDGDPMTRSQIGDTMEALAAHHPGISQALAVRFGGPVQAVRGGQAGTDRQGAWDLQAGGKGIELKSIHAESSQIKIRMKATEIEDKKVKIVEAGLEPATSAIVWQPHDDGGATAHLFAIDGVASGSLRKFDNLGAFDVTPAQYRDAFTTAGYGPALAATAQLILELGDVEGHDFHGNQWTGGTGRESEADRTRHALDRAAEVKVKVDAAIAAGKTTEDEFDKGKFGAPGLWSPEREALHQRIVSDYLTEHAYVPNAAQAVIMGGLPGAGKSTILGDPKLGIDQRQFMTLNPDIMKEKLIEAGALPDVEGLKPMEMAALIHEESSKLTYDLADQAQAMGKNVIWDITMNREDAIRTRMQDLTDDLGPKYNTKMVFVDTPIEVSQERALARYVRDSDTANGGRFVHPDMISSLADPVYGSKNRAAFEQVKDSADSWQLWTNGPGGAQLVDSSAGQAVAAAGRLVLELGDAEGHVFHGNQWTNRGTSGDEFVQKVNDEMAGKAPWSQSFLPPVPDDFQQRLGQCYVLSAQYLLEHPDAELVHGTIQRGEAPPLKHAWNINEDGTVHEPATNRDYTRKAFDKLFNPTYDTVYSNHDAMVKMVETEHYGPWDDGVTSAITPLEFGDTEGHPFHGNQWTGGSGGDRAGANLRPLVQPLTLMGQEFPDDGRSFAVESAVNSGGQILLLVDSDVPKGKVPSSEEAQKMLSTVADLADRYPLEAAHLSLNVVSRDTAYGYSMNQDTIAYVRKGGPATINLVEDKAWKGARTGLMASAREDKSSYIVAHEFGHIQAWKGAVDRGPGMPAGNNTSSMFRAIKDVPRNGMSRYGMDNADEAYAEAFADYQMTNGQSTNKATTAYAEKYNW